MQLRLIDVLATRVWGLRLELSLDVTSMNRWPPCLKLCKKAHTILEILNTQCFKHNAVLLKRSFFSAKARSVSRNTHESVSLVKT